MGSEIFYSVGSQSRLCIEFIAQNPDYSLLKFREIGSFLCQEIAIHYKIEFKNDKLVDQIKCLDKHKIINPELPGPYTALVENHIDDPMLIVSRQECLFPF